MSCPNPNDVEKLLESMADAEPPTDLLGRLAADVPPVLHVVREDHGAVEAARPFRRTAAVMAALGLAAMLVIAFAIGVLRLPGGPTPSSPVEAVRPTAPPVPTVAPAVPTPVPAVDEAAPAAIDPPAPAPQPAATAPPTVIAKAASGSPGTLQVVVADEQGLPLPGATATLSSPALQGPRTTVTDIDGKASFPDLPDGRYDLEARLDGFQTIEAPGIGLPKDIPGRVEVRMAPAAFGEGITVAAETVVIDVTKSTTGTTLRSNELPLASNRSFQSVIAVPDAGSQRPTSKGKKTPVPATRAPADRFPATPSTGGSKEPNGKLHGDVFFEHAGVNPFVDTDDDPLSTFGLDVDTASYTIARRFLADGALPPREAVRVEEFVNFFDTEQRPPSRGDFAVRLEGAPSPFAAGNRTRLVSVGIRARDVAFADARRVVLTIVLDTSGSMQGARLDLAKQSLGLLLERLRPQDEVGLVQFNTTAAVVSTPTRNLYAIRVHLASLEAGGTTNASHGLRLAYDLAEAAFDPAATNRVLLLSDGVANEGLTDAESILARIVGNAAKGIELTAVGVGMGNYNDVLLEKLADKGNGRYAYVDTIEEAHRVFVEDITGTLQTIGADAKVQVEFNPRVVARYRLLGYENRDVADEDFRNDTVDGGEIGAGHHVTALYEVKLQPDAAAFRRLATVRLRYRPVDRQDSVEVERALRLADLAPAWEDASTTFRLAAVAAEFAEILRGSTWAKGSTLGSLVRGRERGGRRARRPPRGPRARRAHRGGRTASGGARRGGRPRRVSPASSGRTTIRRVAPHLRVRRPRVSRRGLPGRRGR